MSVSDEKRRQLVALFTPMVHCAEEPELLARPSAGGPQPSADKPIKVTIARAGEGPGYRYMGDPDELDKLLSSDLGGPIRSVELGFATVISKPGPV